MSYWSSIPTSKGETIVRNFSFQLLPVTNLHLCLISLISTIVASCPPSQTHFSNVPKSIVPHSPTFQHLLFVLLDAREVLTTWSRSSFKLRFSSCNSLMFRDNLRTAAFSAFSRFWVSLPSVLEKSQEQKVNLKAENKKAASEGMEQPHCPSRLASLTVAAPSLIALHNFLDLRSWTLFPKRIKIVLLNFTIVVWVAFIYSSTCFVNQSYNALPVIYGPQIKKHLSTAFGEASTKSCSAQEADLCLLNCLFFPTQQADWDWKCRLHTGKITQIQHINVFYT